jgi:hypothetical protein
MKAGVTRAVAAVLALSCLVGAPVEADDSTAALAAGGIVLTKSSTIAMRSENLYISEAAVRAQFKFVNTAARDATVTVAFPLPDVTTGPMEQNANYPVDSATNFLGFSTLVGGRPVKMQIEQKALQNGHDYTALLQKMGVPLAPQRDATDAVLKALPRVEQDQLVQLGLADDANNPPDTPKDAKLDMYATWTLKTTFYWTQTFPAGREVDIEQTYQPSVGSSVPRPFDANEDAEYCFDGNVPKGNYEPNFIDYVLTSGGNWKGPIGDFTMTIDKGSVHNVVSFCGNGVRQTSPTTFQVHYTDFTPTRDVHILLFEPIPQ